MSRQVFNGKIIVNDSVALSSDFFRVTLDFYDPAGAFTGLDVLAGDRLYLDTSLAVLETVSYYDITSVISHTSSTIVAEVLWADTTSTAIDPQWAIGFDGLLSRPTAKRKYGTTNADTPLAIWSAMRNEDWGLADTERDSILSSVLHLSTVYVSNHASLNAAVAAIGSAPVTLFIDATTSVTANLSIPYNISVVPLKGGIISNGSYTLAFAGAFHAVAFPCFSGGGAVTFSNIPEVTPQMWGAKGDGSGDDSAAINLALATGARVHMVKGAYKIAGALTVPANGAKEITGDGADATSISTADSSIDLITISAGAYRVRICDLGLSHTVKGTGKGIVTSGTVAGLLCERVIAERCSTGFSASNLAWMHQYNQCRANSCDLGFFANGQTAGNTGEGTTLIYNQCYTSSCTAGFAVQYITQVQFNMPVSDLLANIMVNVASCRSISIKDLHLESSTRGPGQSVVYIQGSGTHYVDINNMVLSALSRGGGTCAAVRVVNSVPNGFILKVRGVQAGGVYGMDYVNIAEQAGHAGAYYLDKLASTGTADVDNLNYPGTITLTGGGKVYYEDKSLSGLFTQMSASLIAATDVDGRLQSLSTTGYPSLAELAYVKGLTSTVQTQINNIVSGATAFTGQITTKGFRGTVLSSTSTTGSIAFDLSAGDLLWLNSAGTTSTLTGDTTFTLTNPVAGEVAHIFFKQASAPAKAVILSCAGVVFYESGTTASSTDTLTVSVGSDAGKYIHIDLEWLSATRCIVNAH